MGRREPRPDFWAGSLFFLQGTFLSWALPLACTVLFYGLAGGMWKQAALTNSQFCLLMVAVKSVINWLYWAGTGRPTIALNNFLKFSLIGQLFNGVAWIFYFRALETGPAGLVATVTAAYTALAAVLALVFLKERMVGIQLVGIALAIVAGLMLGNPDTGGDLQLGGWFVASLITLLCWAISVVFFKHAYNQGGANDSVGFLANWVGMCLTLLPYGLGTGGDLPPLGLGWVIVTLYAVGDLTLFAAIGRGPAAIVSPLSGMYPIPTLIYASLVLNEKILPLQGLATVMVLIAIVLVVPAEENPIRVWMNNRRQTQ
jgi:drug/metabolite transporter (DMT)-like permease